MKQLCLLILGVILVASCNDAISNSIKTKSSVYDSIKIGRPYQGGIIYFIDSFRNSGLIASDRDLGELGWTEGIDACKHFHGGQYSDWHLPDQKELNLLLKKMADTVGGFVSEGYWSSSYDIAVGYGNDTVYLPYYQYIHPVVDIDHYVWRSNYKVFGVRPIRSFKF